MFTKKDIKSLYNYVKKLKKYDLFILMDLYVSSDSKMLQDRIEKEIAKIQTIGIQKYLKIYKKVVSCPLKETPLYINAPGVLSDIIKWRLKHGR